MRNLINCRQGTTAIEYALFAMMAAIIISSGVSTIGEKIGSPLSTAAGAMAAETKPDRTANGTSLHTLGNARYIEVDECDRSRSLITTQTCPTFHSQRPSPEAGL